MSRSKKLLEPGRPPQNAVTRAFAELIEQYRQGIVLARAAGDDDLVETLVERRNHVSNLAGNRTHRHEIEADRQRRAASAAAAARKDRRS
jgi:hypothetical protein